MRRRWARRSETALGLAPGSRGSCGKRGTSARRDAFSSYYAEQQGFAGSFQRPGPRQCGRSPLGIRSLVEILPRRRSRRDGRGRTWIGRQPGRRRWLSISRTFPLLANRITDALYPAARDETSATRVTMVHAVPAPSGTIDIVERALLPFDFTRFHVTPPGVPPIVTLPPGAAARSTRRRVRLCRAVRGGDIVLRR